MFNKGVQYCLVNAYVGCTEFRVGGLHFLLHSSLNHGCSMGGEPKTVKNSLDNNILNA